MLKKKVNGAWSNISNVKRKTNGSWTNCTSVKKKNNGAWTIIYPSSTFAVRKKEFKTNSFNPGVQDLSQSPFTTATVTNLGSYFQITASGGATKPAPSDSNKNEWYNVGFGNKVVGTDDTGNFSIYIDQEIIEYDNASVRAVIIEEEPGGWNYQVISMEKYFTQPRKTISIYVPETRGIFLYRLYFSISSNYRNFTGSTSTPSATARIYGMWSDTTKYDLSQ